MMENSKDLNVIANWTGFLLLVFFGVVFIMLLPQLWQSISGLYFAYSYEAIIFPYAIFLTLSLHSFVVYGRVDKVKHLVVAFAFVLLFSPIVYLFITGQVDAHTAIFGEYDPSLSHMPYASALPFMFLAALFLPVHKPQKLLKFAAVVYVVYAVIATYGAIRSGSFGTDSILLLITAGVLIYVASTLTSSTRSKSEKERSKRLDKAEAIIREAEVINEQRKRIDALESILNAFHIDVEVALEMHEVNELSLHRAGKYGAALMQAYGGCEIGFHQARASKLMEKWLWTTPGYKGAANGAAEIYQQGVNDHGLQPLLKE